MISCPAAQLKEKVAAGAVTLDKFVITKQLTKRPEDYPDARNQPHVQVALRRRAQHKREGTLQVPRPARTLCLVHVLPPPSPPGLRRSVRGRRASQRRGSRPQAPPLQLSALGEFGH